MRIDFPIKDWKSPRTLFALGVVAILLSFFPRVAAKRADPEKFPLAESFIDLNGGLCRLTGRRICNQRIRLEDGALGYADLSIRHLSDEVTNALARAEAFRRLGLPFVHCQMPFGMDAGKRLLPPDAVCDANEKAAEFVRALRADGIDVLDLIDDLAKTPEDVRRNFYRTDHHWRNEAAFGMFRRLLAHLGEMLGDDAIRATADRIDEEWMPVTAKTRFLGSHGKRTGRLFAGTDEVTVYLPRFETHLTRRDILRGSSASGDFRDVCMRRELVEEDCGAWDSTYTYYMLVRDGLLVYENAKPRFDRRIAVLTDSFGRPVLAFLATLFKEVHGLDPRRLPDAYERVNALRPDAVIRIMNPTAIGVTGWNER